ncbi:MAG: tetratricopeptide repeat protein [Flavobacteriales bacterium]
MVYTFNKTKIRTIFFFLILSFVFYGNTLKNKYALDDSIVVLDNESVKNGIKGLPKIFTEPYVKNQEQSYGYRPITIASFALEYQFFGENPKASHFINVLLYGLTCFLLFSLLQLLLGDDKYSFSLFITLIFLIHPIHSEIVNNIKSRDELLFLLLGLAGMNNAILYFDSKKISKLILSVLWFLLALLSKYTALVLIFVLPIVFYYFRQFSLKRVFRFYAYFFFGFSIYFLGKKYLLDVSDVRYIHFWESPIESMSFLERIPASISTFWFYLYKLIFPFPLVSYYGYNEVMLYKWSDFQVYIILLIHLFLVGIALWQFRQRNIISFGIALYFIALIPFSNLTKPIMGIVAERYAYIASIGFSIILTSLIWRVLKIKPSDKISIITPPFLIIALIGLISLVYTFNRNQKWENSTTLFANDIEVAENSYNLHNLYSSSLLIEIAKSNLTRDVVANKVSRAKKSLQKAIEIYPEYYKPYLTLANIELTYYSNIEEAKHLTETAHQIDSVNYNVYILYARIFNKSGDSQSAESMFRKAIEISYNRDSYAHYITFLLEKNREDDAIVIIEEVLSGKIQSTEEFLLIAAELELKRNNLVSARSYYERYHLRFPQNQTVIENLYRINLSLGDNVQAKKYYDLRAK